MERFAICSKHNIYSLLETHSIYQVQHLGLFGIEALLFSLGVKTQIHLCLCNFRYPFSLIRGGGALSYALTSFVLSTTLLLLTPEYLLIQSSTSRCQTSEFSGLSTHYWSLVEKLRQKVKTHSEVNLRDSRLGTSAIYSVRHATATR